MASVHSTEGSNVAQQQDDASAASQDPFASFHDSRIAPVCVGLASAEFCTLALSLPLCALFARLVGRTAVLHAHLKAILVAQTIYVGGNGALRLYILGNQWAMRNIFWFPPNLPYAANYALLVFSNLLGHVLITERILATVWFRRYEQFRDWTFTATWALVISSLAAIDAYCQVYGTQDFYHVADINFYTYLLMMLASFAEIFVMVKLNARNKTKFRDQQCAAENNSHTLSVRYQLNENIRAGRQLGPTFLCHFLSSAISFLVVMNIKFRLLTSVGATALILSVSLSLQALINFCMVLTCIVFHPLLNRSAKKLLRPLWEVFPCRTRNAVNPAGGSFATELNGNGSAPSSRLGEQEAHFRDLRKMWGD